jgi:HK97 family phage major capsid protein
MSYETATRGRYVDGLAAAGRRLLHQERSTEEIESDITQQWTKIVPGSCTQAQADKLHKLHTELLEAQNRPAYAASTASRSRASGPAGTAHRHTCPGCNGGGIIDAGDPKALARLTPAARRTVLAQARAAVPVAPRRTLAELRQRAHQITDASLRDDPEYLMRAEYAPVRDAALRCIETKGANLPPTVQDRLSDLVRSRTSDCDGKAVARHVVVTSSDPYVRAFAKSLAYAHPAFDPDEGAAVRAYRSIAPKATWEERAAGEGGSFGLAVPVMIDPAITISATLDDAPILQYARTVFTTTDVWKGITSAGTGFTLPGEGVVVADGSPAFTQPSVTIFAAKDFVPFSIEVSQDYPGFAAEIGRLFAAEYADRLSQDTTIGAGGSAAPMGIFTRMALTTAGSGAAHVTVTTPGAICAADVRAVWQALPERAKNDPSCAWLMSNSVWSQITALGAPSVTNGLEPGAVQYPVGNAGPRLYGEPVIFSSYAPAFTNTSGTANYAVVGAFHSYAIAQRVGGLTVELVPLVPNFPASNLPSGNRGFLAVARFGSDALDTASFRLLSN